MEQLRVMQQRFDEQQYGDYLSDVDVVLAQLTEQQQWSELVTQLFNKVRAYLALNNKLAAANVLTEHQQTIAMYSTLQQQIMYYHLLATAQQELQSDETVFAYLQKAKLLAELYDEQQLLPMIYYHISVLYSKSGELDESFTYAKRSVELPMNEHTPEAIRRKLYYIERLVMRGEVENASQQLHACEAIIVQMPMCNETIYCWEVEAKLLHAMTSAADAYTYLKEKLAQIAEHSVWCDLLYDAICTYAKESQPNAVYIAELQRALTMKGRVLAIQNQQQLELLQTYVDDANMKKLAWTDALTNIPNRRYLQQLYPSLSLPFTAFLFDVDSFKRINDTAGHLTGDDVLKEIVRAITAVLPTNAHFIRLGGDEFFGILYDEPKTHVQRMLKAVRKIAVLHEGRNIRPTISVGMYTVRDEAALQEVLQHADEALYMAKSRGKDQYVWLNEYADTTNY